MDPVLSMQKKKWRVGSRLLPCWVSVVVDSMDAHAVGATYVVLPSAPTAKDMDGYKRQAEEFNLIGAAAAKYGVRFAFHNHGNGLKD